MKKLLVVAIAFLILAPGLSLAGYVAVGPTKIISIRGGYEDTGVFFTTEAAHINPNNCINDFAYRFDPSNSDTKAALAILLTAYTNQHDVNILVKDDSCSGNHPNIHRIQMVRPTQ